MCEELFDFSNVLLLDLVVLILILFRFDDESLAGAVFSGELFEDIQASDPQISLRLFLTFELEVPLVRLQHELILLLHDDCLHILQKNGPFGFLQSFVRIVNHRTISNYEISSIPTAQKPTRLLIQITLSALSLLEHFLRAQLSLCGMHGK